MFLYDKFFSDYDKTVTQMRRIFHRGKERKSDQHFQCFVGTGVIPIVNENDSVSYTKIESEERLFGDNDMLSAVVAVLCRAEKLVIFSDIDGLYDSASRLHPHAKRIERIEAIDESVYVSAGGAGSRRGTGGMRTKLQAAELITAQGIDTVIINGKTPPLCTTSLPKSPQPPLFVGRK